MTFKELKPGQKFKLPQDDNNCIPLVKCHSSFHVLAFDGCQCEYNCFYEYGHGNFLGFHFLDPKKTVIIME